MNYKITASILLGFILFFSSSQYLNIPIGLENAEAKEATSRFGGMVMSVTPNSQQGTVGGDPVNFDVTITFKKKMVSLKVIHYDKANDKHTTIIGNEKDENNSVVYSAGDRETFTEKLKCTSVGVDSHVVTAYSTVVENGGGDRVPVTVTVTCVSDSSSTANNMPTPVPPGTEISVPAWIKNTAQWWAEGQTTDKEFASAMGYLIKQDILHVSANIAPGGELTVSDNLSIPVWIKNNAKWWAQGQIGDQDFLSGTQYMVNNDIIKFSAQAKNENQVAAAPSKVISPETYEIAYETMAWNQVAMDKLLRMKGWEADTLGDTSEKLWKELAETKDMKTQDRAIKYRDATTRSQDEEKLALKILQHTRDQLDSIAKKAKENGVTADKLEKAASEPLKRLESSQNVRSIEDYKDARADALDAERHATDGLKDLLAGFGVKKEDVMSYEKMGFWLQREDPNYLPSSAAISPDTGATIASDDKKLIVKIPPGAVDAGTSVSITTLTDQTMSKEISSLKPLASYRLEPDGLKLKLPAVVVFFGEPSSPEKGVSSLILSTRQKSGDVEPLQASLTTVSLDSNKVVFRGYLNHFSELFAQKGGVKAWLKPASVNLKVGDIWRSTLKVDKDATEEVWGNLMADNNVVVQLNFHKEFDFEKSTSTVINPTWICANEGTGHFGADIHIPSKLTYEITSLKIVGNAKCNVSGSTIVDTNVGEEKVNVVGHLKAKAEIEMDSDFGQVRVDDKFENHMVVKPGLAYNVLYILGAYLEQVRVTPKVIAGPIKWVGYLEPHDSDYLAEGDPDYPSLRSIRDNWLCTGAGQATLEEKFDIITHFFIAGTKSQFIFESRETITKTATVNCKAQQQVGTEGKDGILTIVKTVINDGGGTKQASDFNIKQKLWDLQGDPVEPLDPQIKKGLPGNPKGEPFAFAQPRKYEVTEDPDPEYKTSYRGDCKGTINPGDDKVCLVENKYIPKTPIKGAMLINPPLIEEGGGKAYVILPPIIEIRPGSDAVPPVKGNIFGMFLPENHQNEAIDSAQSSEVDLEIEPETDVSIGDLEGITVGDDIEIDIDDSIIGGYGILDNDNFPGSLLELPPMTTQPPSAQPPSTQPPMASQPPQVSANPPSLSVTHAIGSSPCPTPLGTVSLSSNQQGTWSITFKPAWIDASLGANTLTASFNCNISSLATQTLYDSIRLSFTSSSGSSVLGIPVSVQVQAQTVPQPPPTQPPTTSNAAPNVSEIQAVLNPPMTTYSVTGTDPDGDTLTYTWTNTNPCGSFTSSGNQAVWSHPHPPCPAEMYNPGLITVVVSDGHGHQVTKTYERGSLGS